MMNMTKSIVLFVSLLLAAPSFAETTNLLKCSTDGNSLAEMRVEYEPQGSAGTLVIQFEEVGDEDAQDSLPLRLPIQSGLKDLIQDTSATVLAKKNTSYEREGGAYYDAALLRVVDGKKRAFLAVHGNVYIMHCY